MRLSFRIAKKLVIAFTVFNSATVQATEISGMARIIDGDTLAIGTQIVRLHGIDAPENAQNCTRKNGKTYNCGAASEKALLKLLQKKTTCTGDSLDAYARLIAICISNDVVINREMVRTGHALAYRKYSTDYVDDEDFASSTTNGMWEGRFEKPWNFRASKWKSATADAPLSDCPIKGNINRKGDRIYHTPWSRSYKRTRIDTDKSERWFCTEAEALAAGWRAPYR
ncbi:MAG: thermonuclease family protein [Granulosicoccus sp.]